MNLWSASPFYDSSRRMQCDVSLMHSTAYSEWKQSVNVCHFLLCFDLDSPKRQLSATAFGSFDFSGCYTSWFPLSIACIYYLKPKSTFGFSKLWFALSSEPKKILIRLQQGIHCSVNNVLIFKNGTQEYWYGAAATPGTACCLLPTEGFFFV